MKKILLLLIVIATVLSQTSCGIDNKKIKFKYQSGSHDYTSEMYYDDSLFDHPSDMYDPSLSTASISFAMASFASADGGDYTRSSQNAVDLLQKMGYSDVDTNAFYKEKPGTDSLGCVFGNKVIGGYRMIACGIRGANYGAEWASNFTIGDSVFENYHQGFYEGSEIFIKSLKDYISDKGIEGEIKLWMVGYSRAGAVCNIAAGRIDEAINKKENILGDGVKLKKIDLYAYCFEAPRGVYCDEKLYPKSEIFNNIFCIVSNNDIVPLAMREFSLTRYGTDKVLYDNLNDIEFAEHIEKMYDFYDDYENSDVLGDYSASGFDIKRFSGGRITGGTEYFNWAPGIFVGDLLRYFTLYGVKDRERFVNDLQQGLREIFNYVFSKSSPSASVFDLGLSVAQSTIYSSSAGLLFDDLFHNHSKLSLDLKIVLLRALEMLNVDISVGSVVHTVEKLLSFMISALDHDSEYSMLLSLISKNNLVCIARSHQPELILSYLRTFDPKYESDPAEYDMEGKFYYIEIDDTSANVGVLYDGKEIVSFKNGQPEETGSTVAYGRHKKLMIYLPYNSEYTITSSSDEISIKVYDPALSAYVDFDISAEKYNGSYRVVIPAVK